MEKTQAPYMVEQVIKFSDGTETVISYNELGDRISKEVVDEIESSPEPEEAVTEEIKEEVIEEIAPESIEDSEEN